MRYFVLRGDKKYGPATVEQLAELLSHKKVALTTQILTEDRSHQCALGELPEFAASPKPEATDLTQVEEFQAGGTRLEPPSNERKTLALSQLIPKVELEKLLGSARETTEKLGETAKPRLKQALRELERLGISPQVLKFSMAGIAAFVALIVIVLMIRKTTNRPADPIGIDATAPLASSAAGSASIPLQNGKRLQILPPAAAVPSALKLEKGRRVILEGVITKTGPDGAVLQIQRVAPAR